MFGAVGVRTCGRGHRPRSCSRRSVVGPDEQGVVSGPRGVVEVQVEEPVRRAIDPYRVVAIAIPVTGENHVARVAVEEVEGEAAGGEGSGAPSMSGEIRSRDDAMRVLDRVSEYFRKNEPSSPVPLLLQRAKRLISKSTVSATMI